MKFNNNSSFPYPVLGNSDDILPMLPVDSLTKGSKEDSYSYTIQVCLKQENGTISRLIQEGSASYVCEVDCSKTFYNRVVKFQEPTFEVSIKKKDVSGRVNLYFYVLANRPLQDYKNEGFNPVFKSFTFDLETGDLLAIFPSTYVDLDIASDKLQAAGSYMEIRKQEDTKVTRIDLSGDKIAIILPPDLYDLYRDKVGPNNVKVIYASLAFNALTVALFSLHEYVDKENLWARCIQAKINGDEALKEFKECDYDIPKERVFDLAQYLLDNPYTDLLKFLEDSMDNQDSEE
jgi:hypothetical protein